MKKINFKALIPYILVLLLIGVSGYFINKNNQIKETLTTETNLRLALMDSVTSYKNKRNEWVAEKRTLQYTITDKEFKEKELTKRIIETEKRNATLEKKVTVFAAALIESQVIIDSLQNSIAHVSEKDSSVTFTSDNPSVVEYTLLVKPVLTIKNITPKLTFKDFKLPNKQFIEFHWRNNVKEGYPISFSTTNTNPYFKTVNIESYAIPEMKKDVVKPGFWKRTGTKLKKVGEVLIYVGMGVGAVLILK